MGDLTADTPGTAFMARIGQALWLYTLEDGTGRGWCRPVQENKANTPPRIASARWRGLTEVFHPQVSTPSRVRCKCHNSVCSMAWRDELSLAQVPGEGEHKIMQYIRATETMATPPTRHCRRRVVNLNASTRWREDAIRLCAGMYGNDADLIMLGLTSRALLYVTPRGRLRREQSSA